MYMYKCHNYQSCYQNIMDVVIILYKSTEYFYGLLSIQTFKVVNPFNKHLRTINMYKYSTNINNAVIKTHKKFHKRVNG